MRLFKRWNQALIYLSRDKQLPSIQYLLQPTGNESRENIGEVIMTYTREGNKVNENTEPSSFE